MKEKYQICRRCKIHYFQTSFLAYRLEGYCTMECSIGEPRGITTAEAMAWKDKISIPSLRERLTPLPETSLPIRSWKFDLVQYPPPRGWQIENWRIEILEDQFESWGVNKKEERNLRKPSTYGTTSIRNS